MEKLCLFYLLAFSTVASAAVCTPPFESVGENCYYFSSDTQNWHTARQFCQLFGGIDNPSDLAVFDFTCEDYVAISRHASQLGMTYPWVGANDEISDGFWLWSDGRPVDLSKTYWYPGNPSSSSSYNCAYMNTQTDDRWRLLQSSCTSTRDYICQSGIEPANKYNTTTKNEP